MNRITYARKIYYHGACGHGKIVKLWKIWNLDKSHRIVMEKVLFNLSYQWKILNNIE